MYYYLSVLKIDFFKCEIYVVLFFNLFLKCLVNRYFHRIDGICKSLVHNGSDFSTREIELLKARRFSSKGVVRNLF